MNAWENQTAWQMISAAAGFQLSTKTYLSIQALLQSPDVIDVLLGGKAACYIGNDGPQVIAYGAWRVVSHLGCQVRHTPA